MLKNIIATCLLVGASSAQSFFIPDSSSTTGGCNVIPFGHRTAGRWSNQKYQCLVTAADLGNKVIAIICELGFVPCVTGIRHFDTIEIVLAQTNATTLSSTWTANLSSNVQTVLKAKNYDWHQVANKWNRIGLDKSYLYLNTNGKNLVVQVTVTGAILRTSSTSFPGHRTGNRPRRYAYNWTGSPPLTSSGGSTAACKIEVNLDQNDLNAFGTGCRGSNGTPSLSFTGSAKQGGSATIDLAAAAQSASTALIVDITRNEPGIDLRIVGAPGCSMYLNNALTVFGNTDASGTRSVKVGIPNLGACVRVYVQYFVRDSSANNFGWTTSNYGRMLIGN